MAHDEIPEWVRGWDEYRRTLDEDAEERAYEAGFRRGRASALERDRGRFEVTPGTIQWAVKQLKAGRAVTRKHADWLFINPPAPSIIISLEDVMATDWQIAETPDSPCDCP